MQDLTFGEVKKSFSYFIEEEKEFIKFPVFLHQSFEASHFVIRSDQDVRTKIVIIEMINEFQNVFWVRFDHIIGFFFNIFNVELWHLNGLNCINFASFFVFALFNFSKRPFTNYLLSDVLIIFSSTLLIRVHHHFLLTYQLNMITISFARLLHIIIRHANHTPVSESKYILFLTSTMETSSYLYKLDTCYNRLRCLSK